MAVIRPFRALRPASGLAAEVAAPPYDVVSTAEARALAGGNPHSFLRVSRPEIDLPDAASPDDVHAHGARVLARLVEDGVLVQDDEPGLLLYRLSAVLPGVGEVQQTGVVCCASVAEYEDGRIATHEKTRPDKEDDRIRHVDALDAHDEPVFLMHRPSAALRQLVAELADTAPDEDLTCEDGVRHTLWRVTDEAQLVTFTEAFDRLPRLYVADGHHRSAAAARVARERRAAGLATAESESFLSVVFDADTLTVLPYHRVVADLPDGGEVALLDMLRAPFTVTASPSPVTPAEPGRFGLYLPGRWFELQAKEVLDDAGERPLDVSILQDRVLAPVFGITDPRTDPRLRFVGGIRGTAELERLVDGGEAAAAFTLYPTSAAEVMDVADRGEDMPPKSTWFEPKLRSGLFVHRLR